MLGLSWLLLLLAGDGATLDSAAEADALHAELEAASLARRDEFLAALDEIVAAAVPTEAARRTWSGRARYATMAPRDRAALESEAIGNFENLSGREVVVRRMHDVSFSLEIRQRWQSVATTPQPTVRVFANMDDAFADAGGVAVTWADHGHHVIRTPTEWVEAKIPLQPGEIAPSAKPFGFPTPGGDPNARVPIVGAGEGSVGGWRLVPRNSRRQTALGPYFNPELLLMDSVTSDWPMPHSDSAQTFGKALRENPERPFAMKVETDGDRRVLTVLYTNSGTGSRLLVTETFDRTEDWQRVREVRRELPGGVRQIRTWSYEPVPDAATPGTSLSMPTGGTSTTFDLETGEMKWAWIAEVVESVANQPVDESSFTVDALPLVDGDEFYDKVAKRRMQVVEGRPVDRGEDD